MKYKQHTRQKGLRRLSRAAILQAVGRARFLCTVAAMLLLNTITFSQQETVTLDSCIRWAKEHYPLIRQSTLAAQNGANNLKSINENWYPHLSFMAKGTYQTEVVSFNFPGMNVDFPHDSYVANVSLDQTLFDGGQTKKQKQIENLNTNMEVQKNEVELYKLIERVSQLYVNALLSRENLEVLKIYQNDLENKSSNLSASLRNGLALQSSLDELEAEALKTEQSIVEAQDNLKALYQTLSMYTGKNFDDGTALAMIPAGGISAGEEVVRPELKLLDMQQELLDARHQLTNKLALPKVSFTAGANYGRPGPNFINQELRFFGDAGINIKWNISSLYGLSKEKNKFNINQQMIDVQREVFLFNIKNTLTTQTAQINSLREMISRDKLIIEKRHNVTMTASSQLENGKITVTDYLTQLNAEMQATLSQKIHEIKLMNAMTSYNTTKGINNF